MPTIDTSRSACVPLTLRAQSYAGPVGVSRGGHRRYVCRACYPQAVIVPEDQASLTLAEWHARPVGELSLARQAVYAAALSRDFPAGVSLRPWLRVIGGSERLWRAFVRGASEDEIVWAQTALDARGA